jgi:TetR/AcrR family transcriptional repressor of nem operon
MTGRPKNFDERDALQSAMELFWRRGYEATSLDDLLRAMTLSKSSFYAEFKSKEWLYRACLRSYQGMIVAHLEELRESSASIREFFDKVFTEVINDATSGDPRGCLIVNSAIEFGQHKSEFRLDVRTALEAVQKTFEAAIQHAVRSGEFDGTSSPKLLAKYLTTCISGLRAMIKGGMTAKDAKSVGQKVLDAMIS